MARFCHAAGKTYVQMLKNNAVRKTNKRTTLLKKKLRDEKKRESKSHKVDTTNFSALHLLNDPQVEHHNQPFCC